MRAYRDLQEALMQQLTQLSQLPEIKGPNIQRLPEGVFVERSSVK